MPKLSAELKEAILLMPAAEKDKLLLRLVSKDEKLCQKLEFQLLEEGASLAERRADIRETIDRMAVGYHYSPGLLMMEMRSVNGMITAHVKTTKDKMGEVSLTLYLLNRVYEEQMPHLAEYSSRADTAADYIARRTQFILQKLEKLHPDYYVEFADDVNKLLANVHTTPPARYAKELNLPRQWNY